MTKALLKKQIAEVFSWLFNDRKTGKKRSKNGMIQYAVLYLFVFAFLGLIFYQMAQALCEPLIAINLGWLYMAIMSLVAVTLGVFGSVFNTYASLYRPKDNDLLLSMPIPVSKILLMRLFGVYIIGLMYELIVMIPTLLVYFIHARFYSLGVLGYLFSLLIPILLSVFILTLSCMLGFVVALISAKMKNTKIITVIISLAFIAVYYYFCTKAYALLQLVIYHSSAVSHTFQTALYPLYQLGLASEGNILAFCIVTAITAAFFGMVYLILSRSFLKIATANKGSARVRYRDKAVKAGSVQSALLKKELRRFLGSTTYMLNCGLGIALMPVAAIAILVEGRELSAILHEFMLGMTDCIPLIAVALICLLSTMNDITAPSVSLEGKSLWQVQSLPVRAIDVLTAKLKLHIYLTLVPAMLLTAVVLLWLKPTWYFAGLILIAVVAFIVLSALIGLCLNLKMPNLNWTNETVPVKQGINVLLALFGGWAIVFLFSGIYLLIGKWVQPALYLALVDIVIAAVCVLLFRWLREKGTKIFETL